MNRTLPDRIFICGFMGAGKSTIGRALAQVMDVPFHDLDACIEAAAGQSIPAIFEQQGEAAFRKQERAALLGLIRSKKGVIALGGGTLQNQHLTDHIKVNGLLLLIDTPLKVMIERITENKNRPMLLDEQGTLKPKLELIQELQTLYKQRLPFYEQAEVTINPVAYKSVDRVVMQLAKKIRYHVALH